MRWAVLCLLVACSSLHVGGGNGGGSNDLQCSGEPPAGCTCLDGQWSCNINTCGFFEGEDPVACTTPGAGCEIETWEHGCSCSCGSDGWWSCFEETIGSRCPKPPRFDGGIDGPPDATPIDAAPCSRIEAENVGDHPGWTVLYGALSGGLGLSALAGQVPLLLNFTGTSFAIDHEIGPSSPSIAISIDGGTAVVVPGYQSSFSFVSSPVASGLANIEHHVAVTCEGAGCGVDYFDVTCN